VKRVIIVVSVAVLSAASLAGCGRTEELARARLLDDQAPTILGVDIVVDEAGHAVLTARASDPDGGALVYNWGSRALSPPVMSDSSVLIEGDSVDPGVVVAHLVVQDEVGGLATARVELARDGACALCGAQAITIVPTPSDEPCVHVHDRCIARCSANEPLAPPEAGCACECAAGMALCRTNPS